MAKKIKKLLEDVAKELQEEPPKRKPLIVINEENNELICVRPLSDEDFNYIISGSSDQKIIFGDLGYEVVNKEEAYDCIMVHVQPASKYDVILIS